MVEFLGTHEFAWVLDQNTTEFDPEKDPNWSLEGDSSKRVRKSMGVHLENEVFALALEQAGDTKEELMYRSEDPCGDDIVEAEAGLNGEIPPEEPPKFDSWADGYDKDTEGGFDEDRVGELLLATFGDPDLFAEATSSALVGSLGKTMVRRGAAALLKKKTPKQRPEASFGFALSSTVKNESFQPLEEGEKDKILNREAQNAKKDGISATNSMMDVLEGRKGASSSTESLFGGPTAARSGLIGLTAIFKSVAGLLPASSSSTTSDDLLKAFSVKSSLDRVSLLTIQASLLKKEIKVSGTEP